jgi:hypothetical protein
MFHYYINSQPDPKNPVGTVISVLSARVGFVLPTGSGYDISKMATQVLVEHIQAGTFNPSVQRHSIYIIDPNQNTLPSGLSPPCPASS